MRSILNLLILFTLTFSYSQQKISKTDKEWKAQLTTEEYYVIREKGTEPANTGKYNKHYVKGLYTCKACGLELFNSADKYDSFSGWPSFCDIIKNSVKKVKDNSHGMERTEIVCSQCDGHLGHVFNDGPAPTGLRYCVNSVSLNFKQN